MNCNEARDRLVFFADGEDDEVGTHVRGCAACRVECDRVAGERALIKRALRPATPHVRVLVRPRTLAWPFAAAAAAAALLAWIALRPPLQAPKSAPEITKTPPPETTTQTPVPAAPPNPPKTDVPPLVVPDPPVRSTVLPPPTPDSQPATPTPEDRPPPLPPSTTRPDPPRVEVALTLERGTEWKGTRTFVAGDAIRARAAMRIAWGTATIHVKEGTAFTVSARDALTLDSGAVFLENCPAGFEVRTARGTIRDLGTRFMVETDAKSTTTSVFEGRVSCDTRDVEAGQRAYLTGGVAPSVEAMRDLTVFPSWLSKTLAARAPVIAWNFAKADKRYQGVPKDGVLHGVVRDDVFSAGLEDDQAMFKVPARGEFWVTVHTTTAQPLILRCRGMTPESTPYDYTIEKPVLNRAVPLRVPLDRFVSKEGKPLPVGDGVHIIYIWTRDLKALLRIDDLRIAERKD